MVKAPDSPVSLAFIREIFESQNLQTLMPVPPFEALDRMDFGLRAGIAASEDPYRVIRTFFERDCGADTLYFLQDRFSLNYLWLKLPGERILAVGPWQEQMPGRQEIRGRAAGAGIRDEHRIRQMYTFYENVPIIASPDRFESLAIALLSPLFDGRLHTDSRMIEETEASDTEVPGRWMDDVPSAEVIERRYAAEREMMEAVRRRDAERAIRLNRRYFRSAIPPRISNVLRFHKNMMIVFNTVLRKTAEECHVHPVFLDEISAQCSVRIESCTTERQLGMLSEEMIRQYCRMIGNHAHPASSLHVRKVLDEIDLHYAQNLTLAGIAEAAGLSSGYLSALFVRETGSTFSGYLNQVRTEAACRLLAGSRMQVKDIAVSCGFDDFNYFSRVFKKLRGMTPTQYRKQNRRSGEG